MQCLHQAASIQTQTTHGYHGPFSSERSFCDASRLAAQHGARLPAPPAQGRAPGPSSRPTQRRLASVHTMAACLQRLRQLRGAQVWQLRGLAAAAPQQASDDLLECFVDGQSVKIPKGSNVLSACTAAGVDVPR